MRAEATLGRLVKRTLQKDDNVEQATNLVKYFEEQLENMGEALSVMR